MGHDYASYLPQSGTMFQVQTLKYYKKCFIHIFSVRSKKTAIITCALCLLQLLHDFLTFFPRQQSVTDLVWEIAVLEEEVVRKELHLLSLYRAAFDQYLGISPRASAQVQN
jgi:hypothetical protein